MTAVVDGASPARQSLAEQLAMVDAVFHQRKAKRGGEHPSLKKSSVMRSASLRSMIEESLSRQASSKDLNVEQQQQQQQQQQPPQQVGEDLCESSVGFFSTTTMRSKYLKRKQRIALPPVQQRYGRDIVNDWHKGPFTLSDSKITWLSRQHRPLLPHHHKSESSLSVESQFEQFSDAQARKLGMQNMLMLMGMSKEGVVSKVNRVQRSNLLNKPTRKRGLKQIGRSSSKDVDVLQATQSRKRNTDVFDAALALTTVSARKDVKSEAHDTQNMLHCAQTEENALHFQRGTLLPRVVQERCTTPVGILLDAADPIPRLEEVQRCLGWPPRARLALKLLGQSVEGRHREYLLMHMELIADTEYFGAVLANMIALLEQHSFPSRPAQSDMIPEKMSDVFRIINIYRPPEPGETNCTWLMRMHRSFEAARRRLWESLLTFVKETKSNVEITALLVKLSGLSPPHPSVSTQSRLL